MKLMTLALLLTIASPAILAQTAQAEVRQIAQNKPINSHWRLATSMKNWPGKTTVDIDGEKHVAQGHWVVVDVSVHNTSGEARSIENVFDWTGAELVSAAGETYNLETEAGDTYRRLKAMGRQFAPGESRVMRLFFDVANGNSLSHIKISGTDVDGDYQEFKVQF